MEKEEPTQLRCCNDVCGSYKLQHLSIEYEDHGYIINMICIDCGLIQLTTLQQNIVKLNFETEPKK